MHQRPPAHPPVDREQRVTGGTRNAVDASVANAVGENAHPDQWETHPALFVHLPASIRLKRATLLAMPPSVDCQPVARRTGL